MQRLRREMQSRLQSGMQSRLRSWMRKGYFTSFATCFATSIASPFTYLSHPLRIPLRIPFASKKRCFTTMPNLQGDNDVHLIFCIATSFHYIKIDVGCTNQCHHKVFILTVSGKGMRRERRRGCDRDAKGIEKGDAKRVNDDVKSRRTKPMQWLNITRNFYQQITGIYVDGEGREEEQGYG